MATTPFEHKMIRFLALVASLFVPFVATAQIDVGTVGTPVDGSDPCTSGTIYSCSVCGGNA